jgi:hypothetical protein
VPGALQVVYFLDANPEKLEVTEVVVIVQEMALILNMGVDVLREPKVHFLSTQRNLLVID